ncbi:coiled-coil domain-containing protein 83 isoform X2 [Callorhinchus milii]|uniref:Coiled-coil domain-containing protein 83-like protein n=1 Tax=Callorhinchus milii TaxID=7868 RepID=V9KPC7_CALMI|nr:coiled-coil domain-containing protein 83 isoform X2 [Callorhinchus milii]|eukprot:gi/632937678/ref/XP_007900688.1/ PREDICTED: coiled-coil domain-containing protein 83 isoform X2 [Callorhinchus milii]
MGKKKKDEDKVILAEAFLGFRIQLKEKSMEDVMIEVRELEDKNILWKDRNEQLKREQQKLIKALLKQAKEQDKELEQREIINKEQVDQCLREKWDLVKDQIHNIEVIEIEINDVDEMIVERDTVKEYWMNYKFIGSKEHEKAIHLLEKEIRDMAISFQEMADHFQKVLMFSKSKTNKLTKNQMNEKKTIATEKAIGYMDQFSRQEVLENDWLNKEIKVYRQEVAELVAELHKIEQYNVELMQDLFDDQLKNLNLCRSILTTPETEDTDVLVTQVEKLKHKPAENKSSVSRSESAILKVEQNSILMQSLCAMKDRKPTQLGKSVSQNLSYLLHQDEKAYEYLQLGPMEIKLLHVEGRSAPLHVFEPPSKQGPKKSETLSYREVDEWPITNTMLREAISLNK